MTEEFEQRILTRADKKIRNRRAWHRQRLAEAQTDAARLSAAYHWYFAGLATYNTAGGDARELTARLADQMRQAAEQLDDANSGR